MMVCSGYNTSLALSAAVTVISTPAERGLPLANLTKLNIGTDGKSISEDAHIHLFSELKPRDIMMHYDSVVTGSMHDNYNI